jgi:hypothetical protein
MSIAPGKPGPDPVIATASEYLGQVPATVTVSPRRVGYLVRHGDVEQMRAALLTAGAIWGGARGPLLPVEPDGTVQPGWVQVAKVLRPDLLIDFAWDEGPSWTPPADLGWTVRSASTLDHFSTQSTHQLVAYSPD